MEYVITATTEKGPIATVTGEPILPERIAGTHRDAAIFAGEKRRKITGNFPR